MSAITSYGTIFQLGYVPRDYDAALRYWTEEMGAGPFFLREHLVLKDWRYRGTPSDIDLNVAIGYWGDLQVELIHQHCKTPSVYTTWLESGREGVHHFGLDCSDRRACEAACHTAGMETLQDVGGPDDGIFYIQKPDSPNTMLEFMVLTERQKDYFATLREARRTWDGKTDPIR